ncbi:MAG: flagellar hook-associated protein FlgK [Janthinobacterium lividum]
MSLQSALSITGSGLAAVQRQISIVSQNVANASTTGYVREVAVQISLEAGSQPSGVAVGPTQRALDAPLQASVLGQNATVSGLQTSAAALAAIDAAQGTTGTDGTSLATLAGGLQTAFTTLRGNPSSTPQQQAVVGAAQALAGGINALSQAYAGQRQAAQDSLVQQVGVANQVLGQIGAISTQIISLKGQGASTADLENQRDEQLASLSNLVSVHATVSASGDMSITLDDGTQLPTRALSGPLATKDPTIAPGDTYVKGDPATAIPAITLGGQDVTGSLAGGSIGANIALRDTTLPSYQKTLDTYSTTLATRFSGQGLDLFTNGGASVPASATDVIGLSATIQVNAAVVANPTLVRDGTSGTGGTATGTTAVIDAVLNKTFATQNGTPGLVSQAASLTAVQSQDSSAASAALTTQTGVQTSLNSQLDSKSGVSVDQELSNMVGLQNAYGAGGKIISALQSMFNTLLSAVNP